MRNIALQLCCSKVLGMKLNSYEYDWKQENNTVKLEKESFCDRLLVILKSKWS